MNAALGKDFAKLAYTRVGRYFREENKGLTSNYYQVCCRWLLTIWGASYLEYHFKISNFGRVLFVLYYTVEFVQIYVKHITRNFTPFPHFI